MRLSHEWIRECVDCERRRGLLSLWVEKERGEREEEEEEKRAFLEKLHKYHLINVTDPLYNVIGIYPSTTLPLWKRTQWMVYQRLSFETSFCHNNCHSSHPFPAPFSHVIDCVEVEGLAVEGLARKKHSHCPHSSPAPDFYAAYIHDFFPSHIHEPQRTSAMTVALGAQAELMWPKQASLHWT